MCQIEKKIKFNWHSSHNDNKWSLALTFLKCQKFAGLNLLSTTVPFQNTTDACDNPVGIHPRGCSLVHTKGCHIVTNTTEIDSARIQGNT
jgi:hypothetical protein